MMIIPVCESGCFFEENDASEKPETSDLLKVNWLYLGGYIFMFLGIMEYFVGFVQCGDCCSVD